jgi:hypothetical protein
MEIRKRPRHSKIIGIIFPLLPSHIQRFFDEDKKVFVKFFAKENIPLRLRKGSKLFFYESRANRQIVGEATIVDVGTATAEEAIARFGDDLFLAKEELERYVGARKEKRMLVLVVDRSKRYRNALRLEKPITMTGQYMTRNMHESLTSHDNLQ